MTANAAEDANYFWVCAPRVITIGPEAFWDQAGEWTLGTGTFRLKRTLGDHTSQHSLYATLAAPMPQTPVWGAGVAAAPSYALTKLEGLLNCSGFSSLPSTMPRLRLQTAGRGVLLSQSDTSANTTVFNTAHAITVDASSAPLQFTDPTDPILLEFDGPFGGSGYGAAEFWGVRLTFIPSWSENGGLVTRFGGGGVLPD